MAYYFSCMLLFNVIYFCKLFYNAPWIIDDHNSCVKNIFNWITFVIVLFCLLLSIGATIYVACKNDTPNEKQTKGKTIEIVNDITGTNYLGKFSLLVLTGLSIPANEDWLSLVIYLAVFITIGIVYIKENLIYINPILTICNYSIYEGILDDGTKVVILAKDMKTGKIIVKNDIKDVYIVQQRRKKNESDDKGQDSEDK